MKSKFFISGSLLAVFLIFFYSFKVKSVQSVVAMTNVKDTLSNSQLSFFGILGDGNSATETIVRLNTGTTAAPSFSTANLFIGDTIAIGNTGPGTSQPVTNYIIEDIGNTGTFFINTGLGTDNIWEGAPVIATRSAVHTLTFTPTQNFTTGKFQFLIRATSSLGKEQDGLPDQDGFDLGMDIGTTIGLGTRLKTDDITCPLSGTASIGTTEIVNSIPYHVITCSLSAGVTNVPDTSYTMIIGRDLSAGSQLINPSPSSNRLTTGNADIYTYIIRHLDSSSVTQESTQGKIAIVEAVRVTATVDPSITFTISNTGVGVGATPCNNTLGASAANTTATSVAFGSLTFGAFNDLAQRLSCITNSKNGYVVTVYENTVMRNPSTGTTIPDTNCDGACTTDTVAAWSSDTSHSEWGYSIQNLTVGVTAFEYTSGYKAFGIGSSNAKTIMSNTSTPTATEIAYICYRLTASTTQEAGNYENKLVYTATSTF